MNNGFSNIGGPTLNGLVDINADSIASSSIATSNIILNGVDVSTQLNQVPINASNITNLQQVTTGITYNTVGDLTTIDNNLTVGAKNLKCSYATTADDDVVNKLYCDNKIAAVVNSAPVTLDTLNELAIALGNDPNYATSTATLIGGKASKTETQTISGATLMDNASNVFYGDGSNLTGIAATNTSIATSNLGINQVVPLINTQTATAGNYELNIGANYNNNILFNNDTGAITVNTYYGDGSNLSGLQAGITLTSLGANQMVPLINTPTATAGNYPLNLGISNNILFNNDTGALTVNKYYGDGSSLTGIGSGTITTTTMPLTGTYYLPYTTSSTGASGLTAYSDSNIAFDRTNNRLVVPNLNMFGNFTMTGTSPIIATTLNNSLTLTTPSGSTGGLYFQTQGTTRFSVSSAGTPLFQNSIYTNGSSLVGQNANGFNIASTGATPTITISPNNVTALSIASGGISSFLNQIQMTSTDNTFRQISNTFYNFMDTSATAGGNLVGRIYSDAGASYYQVYNPSATFSFVFGKSPTPITYPFQLTSTQATFTNPPICSINCSTSTQLANKAYVDNASSKITTTLLPTTGTYYLPFLTSSVAGSGLTAYSDGNIYFDRTNNRLNVPNLYSYGLADFLSPPTCSVTATTANQLVNKSYVDNASSNSPVGTIIMYGSNTIPSGWLLCNGSNVSKTTYADLWNVIGDTFMFIPPPTGFFTLPNLVGQYPRGAGTNSTLSVTKTTTLGQTIAGQVGKHTHISAFMNSDTQGTTTSKSVVSAVSGLAGLVISSTSVSAPVVTTTATNGTSQTSIDAYKPYPTMLTDETYPNSVSVNYIIKFQTSATPTPLTTPTFTQTTSVLTIQNNAPASGIINFTLDNASSVLQTPLSLSSTDITVSLPITCATAPTIGGHLVNKTYVDALVSGGVGLTSTDQTITGVKTFSNNLITNADVFGRNDGNAFNAASTTGTTIGLYPVGYCFEIIGGTTLPVNLTDLTDNVSIALTKGVWILSGFIVLNKGSGAYTVATKLKALWNVGIAGIKLFPNAAGAIVSIASTSTVTQHVISLGSVNVVVTTAGAIQTMTRNLAMTMGATTSWSISFSGVKIA